MKNTRKKMLLSSVAMLLVALVALGSATYAWFTINRTVTAKAMTVTAATSAGLQITGKNGGTAQDANANWVRDYTFTTTDKILTPTSRTLTTSALGANGYLPGDVSTEGSGARAWDATANATNYTSNWAADAGRPTVGTAAGNLNTTAGTEAAGWTANYMEYRVGVRSSGSDISNVYLKASFTPDATNGHDADKYVRIAILEEGANNAETVKWIIADGGSSTDAIATIDTTNKVPATVTAQANTTTANFPSASPEGVEIGTVTNATPKYYRIVMWYEGQDADCIDANQSAVGSLNIEFGF